MKPLFRWIMGNTSLLGSDVLKESVFRTIKTLGRSRFDWLICSNATDPRTTDQIEKISVRYDVPVRQSSWNEFPLDPTVIPQTYDIDDKPGVPRGDRQGSFWKMCPPRLRLDAHEIMVDNDILLLREPPQIEEFLNSDSVLLSQEDVHSVGKYFKFFKEDEIYNSGLLGFPPHYDLETKIKEGWEKMGSFQPLLSRDEQGLLTAVMKEHKHIVVPRGLIIHAMPEGRAKEVEYDIIDELGQPARIVKNTKFVDVEFSSHNYGYHFLGINRTESHPVWDEYKRRLI